MTSRFASYLTLALVLTMAACTVHQDSAPSLTGPSELAVPPSDRPTAAFNFSTPLMNVPTTFDGSISCAGAGDGKGNCDPTSNQVVRYSWAFADDGSTESSQKVPHTFKTPGTFNVTLTVINNGGFSASATKPVVVAAIPEPKADFVTSPAAPKPGDAVQFNASASRATAGHSLTGYTWDFGDGGSGTGVTTSHRFGAEGAYTITLTVTDDTGQQGTKSSQVTVSVPTTTTP
jgi:PKD repeat protein